MNDRHTRWIDRYRIVKPIGTGGFATVYRAVDERLGSEVALKVLAENHSLVPDIRERFISEAQHLRRVDSYWVASIFDLGETETGQPYMVLELADRGDLDTRVNDLWDHNLPLGAGDMLILADTLAQSLAAIHAADLVHRDVTPANLLVRHNGLRPGPWSGDILLDPGERLVLSDLGYAKDLRVASGITSGGGTAGFAAPEQTGEMTRVDTRADVYGATAVLCWAAIGSRYESVLQEVAEIGMADDPSRRFEDMADWHNAVHEAIKGPDSPMSIARASVADSQPEWARPAMVAVVAVAIILGLLGLWDLSRPETTNIANTEWLNTGIGDAPTDPLVGNTTDTVAVDNPAPVPTPTP